MLPNKGWCRPPGLATRIGTAMLPMRKGRFLIRPVDSDDDLHAAQRLRGLCFARQADGVTNTEGGQLVDSDRYDALCRHILIEDEVGGNLVGCFRMLSLDGGAAIESSYSAQYYSLDGLRGYRGRMVEIGRFCLHPEWHDPDIIRLAWAALTVMVDAEGIEMLFGCSSFSGTDPAPYVDAFAMLKERHLAPRRWLPLIRAPEVFPFARELRHRVPDVDRARHGMPPLLRSYLAMGGWVSDHAVIDPQLDTLHVFTGLEVATMPPARKRLLRAIARERDAGQPVS